MKTKLLNKWHVLVGGFFGYMFDAMDITLLAVSLPAIMKDMDMSMSEGGLLGTATLLGVGLSSVIVGWFSDNYGRRKSLIWSLILFGILTALISLSPNWIVLLLLRFTAGLALGGVWGIIAAYIAESWPTKQRGRAAAFVLSSFPVGAGIAAFLSSVIIPEFGWRALFLAGGGSIFAAIYIYLFVPESEVWKNQKDDRIAKGDISNISIKEIFSPELLSRTILATLVSSFAFVAYWGSTTWIPTFLVQVRGLDIKTMSLFFLILNVGMFIGYNLFGWLSDIIGRKKAIILSFIGTTITFPIYVMVEDPMMILLMGPFYAFFISFVGLFGSYFGELFPTRVRTLGAGFCFNAGRGISAFSPFVLGFIAAKYGLTVGIGICAVFFLFSAITMFFLPNTKIN